MKAHRYKASVCLRVATPVILVLLFCLPPSWVSSKKYHTTAVAAVPEGQREEGFCGGGGGGATGSAAPASQDHPANTTVSVPDYPGGSDHKNNNQNNYNTILENAWALEPPVAVSTEGGDTEGLEWWLEHEDLLRSAWKAWDHLNEDQLPPLGTDLVDIGLREAVDRARSVPTQKNEALALEKWERVPFGSKVDKSHKVFRCPGFLTEEGIQRVRAHLGALSESGIPARRPNAMNRNGLLLTGGVPGGVAGDPGLRAFVGALASSYLRPLGRALFPEFAGDPEDDAEHYAFTIRYGGGSSNETKRASDSVDRDLETHSDASLYTLNINLNLPREAYDGSTLYFVESSSRSASVNANATPAMTTVAFEPGTAVLHRGMTRHGARPLEAGERNNLVIWLHGATEGYVRIAPYPFKDRMTVEERWSAAPARRPALADFLAGS